MDFLERARRGLITSDQDEDIGEFLDALERGHSLCERFNVTGTSRDARRGILEELFCTADMTTDIMHPRPRPRMNVPVRYLPMNVSWR